MSDLKTMEAENARLREENNKLKRLISRIGTSCGNALEELGKAQQQELAVVAEEVSKVVFLIWNNYPKAGKSGRSSQKKVEAAWKAIPAKDRPNSGILLMALVGWSKSEAWTKEGGKFVKGAHRWVKDRDWRDIPEPANERKKATHGITTV